MEDDRELPEWQEVEAEDIPPGLEERWRRREREGLTATVCACGTLCGPEELSCPVCGQPVNAPAGFVTRMSRFFLQSPLGIMMLLMILAALVALLLWI
jgi:hypothetical protein